MVQKFTASDDLKILQVNGISECFYVHAPYYFMLVILCNLQFDFHNALPLKTETKICLVLSQHQSQKYDKINKS